ncbi:hypothetical protein [Candidatus Williamhamiltonella defendens]|uniref:hypothetical protein n=1 Tax=Candidatus Williamhamiltonella defendens TaxID=138072 RepID=UPI001313FD43|nr:hypothetical protein [Candidatus Hamiltonella defensa]
MKAYSLSQIPLNRKRNGHRQKQQVLKGKSVPSGTRKNSKNSKNKERIRQVKTKTRSEPTLKVSGTRATEASIAKSNKH